MLSQFGDSALYAPISGGTFEGSTAGWTFNNASVVSGNEPWNVVSSTDSQSLTIAPGGSAISPSFCVDDTMLTGRFFALSNGPGGKLSVSALWTDSQGDTGVLPLARLSSGQYATWGLSNVLGLAASLPPGVTLNVQVMFSASAAGSSWNIDDVLLDPYAK